MILIIIPLKNEGKTIGRVATEILDYCDKQFRKYRILFIDDKSTDNTIDEVFKLSRGCNIIRNWNESGKGSALKTAYIYVNANFMVSDNDYIVFMDGDGQIRPKEISTFLRIGHLFDADIIIGNKRHKYSWTLYGAFRKIVSKTYNFIVRNLFGLDFEDTQCGLKIFKKKALDQVIENVNVKKFAFDLELIIACREKGFRVVDAPVYIQKRVNRGSVNIKSIIQTLIDTLKIWYRKKKGYYV